MKTLSAVYLLIRRFFLWVRDTLAAWPWGATAFLVILAVVGLVHLVQVVNRW